MSLSREGAAIRLCVHGHPMALSDRRCNQEEDDSKLSSHGEWRCSPSGRPRPRSEAALPCPPWSLMIVYFARFVRACSAFSAYSVRRMLLLPFICSYASLYGSCLRFILETKDHEKTKVWRSACIDKWKHPEVFGRGKSTFITADFRTKMLCKDFDSLRLWWVECCIKISFYIERQWY